MRAKVRQNARRAAVRCGCLLDFDHGAGHPDLCNLCASSRARGRGGSARDSGALASVSCVGCSVVGVEAHDLQEAWLDRALASAGIDRGSWRPGCGVEENRRTVEAVYAYYWRLFLDHPCLQWAGLAGMIGPAFYAGFTDLGFLPDAVRAATHRAMEASSMPPLNRRVERGAGTGA